MRLLGSLQNRIFLASALLATLSIGGALYFVSAQVTAAVEAELRRDLIEAATLVEQQRASLLETATLNARLVADLPKLKAAVGTHDAPTVEPIALDYQQQLRSDLFIVSDAAGAVLAAIGASDDLIDRLHDSAPEDPDRAGLPMTGLWPRPDGLLQLVTVPISIGLDSPELLGTLTVGYLLDEARATRFKSLTGADIAFVAGNRLLASTLGAESHAALAPLAGHPGTVLVTIGDDDYEVLVTPLTTPGRSALGLAGAPLAALVLKSRSERMATLSTIQTALVGLTVVIVLLAIAVSFAVARTITRPLATITAHMQEVATTGDLTAKLAIGNDRGWDDDDARVLATTFNALTESIATFQREASQRERLSSLGRMSSIIAHEIRNPLMIIKAAARQVARGGAASADVVDAAADIDQEVVRLNRLVDDVLDVARPVRVERAVTDVNGICRAATEAALASGPEPPVVVDLDPDVPALETDGERLRTALVNLLTNARQAVEGHARPSGAAGDAPAPVTLRTRRAGERRVRIVVSDHGRGIAAGDLPRVFDPYFTTRRAGTGLGLALTKNIIEALGGVIGITSMVGTGTDITIDLGDAPVPRG